MCIRDRYNKIVTQRNKLLKELTFRPDYEETLDIWDMQLVSYGREVISYRKEFIDQLNDCLLYTSAKNVPFTAPYRSNASTAY